MQHSNAWMLQKLLIDDGHHGTQKQKLPDPPVNICMNSESVMANRSRASCVGISRLSGSRKADLRVTGAAWRATNLRMQLNWCSALLQMLLKPALAKSPNKRPAVRVSTWQQGRERHLPQVHASIEAFGKAFLSSQQHVVESASRLIEPLQVQKHRLWQLGNSLRALMIACSSPLSVPWCHAALHVHPSCAW